MVIVLLVAAIMGSFLTIALLWPLGALIAFAAAPFGGGMLVLVVAVLAMKPSPRSRRTGQIPSSRETS